MASASAAAAADDGGFDGASPPQEVQVTSLTVCDK